MGVGVEEIRMTVSTSKEEFSFLKAKKKKRKVIVE